MMKHMKKGLQLIEESDRLVFLTGAGVSVPSGIPDYRSMDGIYSGLDQPEYLLSHSCLDKEPQKFYSFVRQLYHPEAKPNIIHLKMAELAKKKTSCTIITQNIDQLHQQAGSEDILNFHGNLYDIYCRTCQIGVTAKEYLESDIHKNCGGQLRPNVVLYEEGLDEKMLQVALRKMFEADLVVIVGTTFKVYPFADLIHYKNNQSRVLLVNKEEVVLPFEHLSVIGDATDFFHSII